MQTRAGNETEQQEQYGGFKVQSSYLRFAPNDRKRAYLRFAPNDRKRAYLRFAPNDRKRAYLRFAPNDRQSRARFQSSKMVEDGS